MWSRVLSGTKTGQVLSAGGKEPIQRPFLAGPADRCRVHTYLVCRTELQMVCRQLQADWTSDFGTDRMCLTGHNLAELPQNIAFPEDRRRLRILWRLSRKGERLRCQSY